MLDHIRVQVIADRIRTPSGSAQQMLRPVGLRLARLFGELPTLLPLQRAEEPADIGRRPLPWFGPWKLLAKQRCDRVETAGSASRLVKVQLILTHTLFHHDLLQNLSRS
jgi:hypothetical protein